MLKLEEVLVNAINNPNKKFKHISWGVDNNVRCILWDNGYGFFVYENEEGHHGHFDMSVLKGLRDCWVEVI